MHGWLLCVSVVMHFGCYGLGFSVLSHACCVLHTTGFGFYTTGFGLCCVEGLQRRREGGGAVLGLWRN